MTLKKSEKLIEIMSNSEIINFYMVVPVECLQSCLREYLLWSRVGQNGR